MKSTLRSWLVLAALLVAALIIPSAANALAQSPISGNAIALRLPNGWSLASSHGAPVLQWRSPERLPWSDATLEVRLDGRDFAPAELQRDLRTVTAELTTEQLGTVVGQRSPVLTVWSGGRPVLLQSAESVDAAGPTSPTVSHRARVIPRSDDPGERGHFDVEVTRYRMASRTVLDLPEPVEILGQVVAPIDAVGPRPLVLLLHGRHETCYRPATGRVSVAWPCPDGTKVVPSYRGYTYLQRHLASRGFVTVSISANGINAQDIATDDGGTAARSALVRHHLRLWSDWAAPAGEWEGRVDMKKVMLLGHSRGGEGVQRAVIDSGPSVPWHIAGSALVAPTAALRQTPAYTPIMTLLPTCDGDVGSLDGQVYVDSPRDVTEDPALRSAVTLVGGNHNFFNTEWTPGLAAADAVDDATERPECRTSSSTRISASEERQIAKTYVAAAAQAVLREDGDAMRLLDGSRVEAPSTEDLDVRVAALGGRRITIRPGLDGRVLGTDSASLCEGRTGPGKALCGQGRDSVMTPHWPSAWQGRAIPTAAAMELQWSDGRGRAMLALDAPVDLSRSRAIEARVALDPERAAPDLAFRLVDGAGRVLTVEAPQGAPLPGGSAGGQLWGQTIRAAIPEDTRFDTSDVRAVGVVAANQRGRIWVLDLSGYRPGFAPLPAERLPRLDVRTVEEPEGDAPNGLIRLPLVLDSAFDEQVVTSVEALSPDGATTVERVRFAPGDTRQVLRFEFEGDIRDDVDRRAWSITAYAERHVVVRSPLGRAVVLDDDPTPTLSVTSVAGLVTEGEALRWALQLSAPADYGYVLTAAAVPDPASRGELASDDVPRRWLRRQAPVPDSPTPLHELDLQLVIFIPEGNTTATVRVPTSSDSSTEGSEWLALKLRDELGGSLGPTIEGKVVDG